MIADLMFYASPPKPVLQRCQLNTILNTVAASFSEEVRRQSIRLEVTTPGQPVDALADPNMISEALRALIRNAVDAIGCQGTIVVSLVEEPGRLMMHVADSGPGLSEHAKKHAFDPYFSGREAGRGLGLGLCRAYRIARLHHGEITVAGGPAGCVATITLRSAAADLGLARSEQPD
jgi:signal transduction histidine kinase